MVEAAGVEPDAPQEFPESLALPTKKSHSSLPEILFRYSCFAMYDSTFTIKRHLAILSGAPCHLPDTDRGGDKDDSPDRVS